MTISRWMLLVISPVCLATAVSGQTVHRYQTEFVRYASVQSVSGREARFVEFLKKELPDGVKAETDNMGTLTVQLGTGAPQLLIVTSIDEPGYVVTAITEEGFLRVDSPAGRGAATLFHQFHEGHYVDISAARGNVRGVVALPSSHLSRGRREPLTTERMLIDIGARSWEEATAAGVEILDPVAAVKDIALLAQNRMAGPMLSRKFGAFALVEALKGIAPKQGKSTVFAWSTQGSMRNSGIARLAKRYSAREILLVSPFRRGGARSGRNPVEALDSGVLIPEADATAGASPMLRAAAGAAGEHGIKFTPSATGSVPEARVFAQAKAELLPIAIAVKNPDTLVEVIDLDDLQQLVEFIKLIAQS